MASLEMTSTGEDMKDSGELCQSLNDGHNCNDGTKTFSLASIAIEEAKPICSRDSHPDAVCSGTDDHAKDGKDYFLQDYGYCEIEVSENVPTFQKRLLELTKASKFKEALTLIREEFKSSTSLNDLAKDENQRTAVHYAAGHSRGESTLKALLSTSIGSGCLLLEDSSKLLPLYLSAAYHSKEQFDANLKHFFSKKRQLRKLKSLCTQFAATNVRHGGEILLSITTTEPECLGWMNERKETVLMQATKHLEGKFVLELIEKAEPNIIKIENDYGDTCLHEAARKKDTASAILAAIKRIGPQCLEWQNNENHSVLHIAAGNCKADLVTDLLKLASPDCHGLRDDKGNSIGHYAVQNSDNKVIFSVLESFDPKCLSCINNRRVSVLHLAFEWLDIKAVEKLETKDEKEWFKKDDEGNTVAHYAARNKEVAVVFFAVRRFGPQCLGWKNKAKQSVLYFAIRHFQSASRLITLVQESLSQGVIIQCDLNQNTLLHSLFHTQGFSSSMSDDTCNNFLEAVLSVTRAGVYPQKENNWSQNCLHGTTLQCAHLHAVLQKSLQSHATKKVFQKLLLNSDGLHAVHVFSGAQNLQALTQPLARLSNLTIPDLLHLTVRKGPHKGATCLHFACESGHSTNISYLIKEGLKLSSESDAHLSCIGFAYEKGKLNVVLDAVKASNTKLSPAKLWRLLDPAKRALMLPDLATARQLLASISDESMITEARRDSRGQVAGDVENRVDLKILLRAIQPDSSKLFRCAIKLNLITSYTERLFPAFLKAILESENSEIARNFPERDEFLKIPFTDFRSELAIIDTVSFFDKTEIMCDLILTRQFDLIPACFSLLMNLKSKISMQKGKHEQLKQLYSKVTSIAVNVLEQLYFNSDEDQKVLLSKYIKGEFKASAVDAGANEGPKFPCRPAVGSAAISQVQYRTIMEMVEDVGDADLLATDCLHRLVDDEWHTVNRGFTPKAKFRMNVMSFVFFLVLFAWYITDFGRTFLFWQPDIVLGLYAVSFTVQELAEFLRRRKRTSFYTINGKYRLPMYFKDVHNLFDCSALLFMWTGLLWKRSVWGCLPNITFNPHHSLICSVTGNASYTFLTNGTSPFELHLHVSPENIYACQMILSTSFLLWGFRSASFLSYSERIGPVISMFKCLLIQDLAPFIAIIFVIFFFFGVFFCNLLFPVVTAKPSERGSIEYNWNILVHVFTLPLNLLFTNFDEVDFERVKSNEKADWPTVPNAAGYQWFSKLLMFLFLLLANIVMLNLLIARFSLTVSRMNSKALGIWRKTYFEMLRENQNISPLPLPLSALYYPFEICFGCKRTGIAGKTTDWWLDEAKYPEEYHQFLKFQATQLRRIRPQLSREVTRNKSDTEALMAHTENLKSAVNSHTHETLQSLGSKLDKGLEVLKTHFTETVFSDQNRKSTSSMRQSVQSPGDLSEVFQKLQQQTETMKELTEKVNRITEQFQFVYGLNTANDRQKSCY